MSSEVVSPTLPIIDVKGSHRKIGQGIGESLRDGLREVVHSHQEGLETTVGLTNALEISRILRRYAESIYPTAMEELQGMAEGSQVDPEMLFAINSLQEIQFLAGQFDFAREDQDDGCTSLALAGSVTAEGHVLLAHNEDAGAIRKSLTYVVRAQPDDGPAFVGFAYSGLLLYQGVNQHGIGSVGNALYFNDLKFGSPKLLAYREVLNARYLEDAIQKSTPVGRANGNNHLIANESGDIYDIEVSGNDSALIPAPGPIMVHANHALDERMRRLEPNPRLLNSIMRQHRVESLLSQKSSKLTVADVFDTLSDHSNFPKSVCKHSDPKLNPYTMTIASVVVDVTARELHVRSGYPCENETTTIALSC
jgi:isopenicillin-N N-acyltransferase like protein